MVSDSQVAVGSQGRRLPIETPGAENAHHGHPVAPGDHRHHPLPQEPHPQDPQTLQTRSWAPAGLKLVWPGRLERLALAHPIQFLLLRSLSG